MEDYNIYGWSALHEACYKGYINAVTRFLDYSNSTQKNLIEQRTIDEYRTTPIIIAALGGHMEIIQELVDNGADLTVKLENTRHGIVEIAAIRQDIALLVYLYDKIPDLCKRLRDLMISERLDESSRTSLGRTIEYFTHEYRHVYNEFEQGLKKEEAKIEDLITYGIVYHADFGACLSNFIRLSVDNEQTLSSGVIALVNTIFDDQVRKGFLNTRGIANLVFFLERSRQAMSKRIESLINKLKNSKSVDEFEVEDLFDREDEEKDIDDSAETYLECASLGQAFNYLTQYEDSLAQINADGSNEKILAYIKLLFDAQNLYKVYQLDKIFKEKQDNRGNSMKMKIFNIINMNKKKKEKKLTPIELFLQLENPYLEVKLAKKEQHSDDEDDEKPEEEDEPDVNANRISFERYISSYISCLGNLAYMNNMNKFTISSLSLFELIICYWEQIMYYIHNTNHRISYIILDSIVSSFVTIYNFKIEKSLFERKLEETDHKPRFGNQRNKEEESVLAKANNIILKTLKLIIIDASGKLIHENVALKEKYFYKYNFSSQISIKHNSYKFEQEFDWIKRVRIYLQTLLNLLDSSQAHDRELQIEVLKFLRLIVKNDLIIQNCLINTNDVANSHLTQSLRNLFLRKALPKKFTKAVLLCLWSLTNEDKYYNSYDRKCLLYRELGLVKLMDTLVESEDVSVNSILLEALEAICVSSPRRDLKTGKLIVIQEESNSDRNKVVEKLLKYLRHESFNNVNSNESELFSLLKIISSTCLSSGYQCNVKNQMVLIKNNAIELMLELAKRKNISSRLKAELFHCISTITLNNFHVENVYEAIFKPEETIEYIIKSLIILLLKVSNSNRYSLVSSSTHDDEEVELANSVIYTPEEFSEMSVQINAGLTICKFCYHNEEFTKKIVAIVGRINWLVYKYLIDKLNRMLKKSISKENAEAYFNIQRLRCLLGFQISALSYLIYFEPNTTTSTAQDARVTGMQMMIDIIQSSENSLLRSIVCDYMGRLISMDIYLIEAFVSINAVELLAKSTILDFYPDIGEIEKGNASIALVIFTSFSPEARRRLLKIARKNFKVMDSLLYYNQSLHPEIINQWRHFKQLENKFDSSSSLKFWLN